MADFDFDELDAFTSGAIGPPGQRVFYLQARRGAVVASFRLEKQQVAAMVESLVQLLADLPTTEPADFDPALQEPVVAEWVVGQIGLGHDEVTDRIVVLLQEIDLADDAAETPALDEPGLGTARLQLTREQAVAFVAHAHGVVAAGRPLCPLCGRPKDPDGHLCPRTNGHKER